MTAEFVIDISELNGDKLTALEEWLSKPNTDPYDPCANSHHINAETNICMGCGESMVDLLEAAAQAASQTED